MGIMDKENLEKQHEIRMEHLKMHTMAFNMFRQQNSEYIVLIEPLYLYNLMNLHKPDLLAVEKRRDKLYFHWIEVKGGYSDKFLNEIPAKKKNLEKHFENDILPYLIQEYPNISGLAENMEIYMDYSIFIRAIQMSSIVNQSDIKNKLLKDMGISIFSGENGRVRILKGIGSFWTLEFMRNVEKMVGLNEPVIFTPSYIFSILFTDVMMKFYPEALETENFGNLLKAYRERTSYKILIDYLIKKNNYPERIAVIYSTVMLETFHRYGIFMHKCKRINIGPKKMKKIKISTLIDSLVNGLKNEHIEKYSFIRDYLVDKEIPVIEISISDHHKYLLF